MAPLPVGERLPRRAVDLIEAELSRNRCVGLFGPRQVGKTTIALRIAELRGEGAVTLNMRDRRDRTALAQEDRFFEIHADKLVIIDEAHRDPDMLDIVHRRLEREIHARTGETGFLILGSASVDLEQLAAERLGARLTPIFIEPIQLIELPVQRSLSRAAAVSIARHSAAEETIAPSTGPDVMDTLWLRGGFPQSFLAGEGRVSFAWRKAYLAACMRRPPAGTYAALGANTVKSTLEKIAASQGETFAVEKSPAEFRNGVAYLESLGLLRVLLPWYPNRTGQLGRRPKLFIRDSGLLHALRACPTIDEVNSTPGLVGKS